VAQFRIAVEQYAYVNDINMLKDNNPDYSKNVKIAQSGVLRNILTFAAHKSTRDGNAIISKILTDNVLAQNDLGKMMI
jgi:hypothetical protein